jgi:hypothetical protein
VKVGEEFYLGSDYSLIFSLTICTLGVSTRWLNTQIIDIWLAVFFSLCLLLLQKNKREIIDYLFIGLAFGMLIGSKFTGFIYGSVIFLFYVKSLLNDLNPRKVIFFLIPLFSLGLSWYIRNFIVTGNPFYPVDTPLFSGSLHFPDRVWSIFIKHPVDKINAFISEYRVWVLSILSLPFLLISKLKKSTDDKKNIIKLSFIGLINLLLFSTFVSGAEPHIMVSVIRYSYPVFIPLILSVFLIAKLNKWEIYIALISFMSMIFFNSFSYNPKIIFILIPVVFLVLYWMNRIDGGKGVL